MSFHHVPVLLEETVDALAPRDGGVYVDCTLGGGGHSAAVLAAADCTVIGIDRDPAALAAATERCDSSRLRTVRGSFGDLEEHLTALEITRVDGVLADLGVSSHQLDTADRGFSFRRGGPIDMRMDPSAPLSAAEIVNGWDEQEIADVIFRYGEERRSRRVARAIVAGRPWHDTVALAGAVASAVGRGSGRIHPATRTFQAIRIAVNDELGELERLLPAVLNRLNPCGRLAIITFQSLDDRICKRFLAHHAGRNAPRDPYGNPLEPPSLRLFPPRTAPTSDPNPRARSARLRSAERLPCPVC
ncbi:MAG: 16S rRNA (cytosine1402-N4)-methyltransferase [Myxococcota bacterium]|jgi:16S rRNA (cytosine1402-N4)-methyltransferase